MFQVDWGEDFGGNGQIFDSSSRKELIESHSLFQRIDLNGGRDCLGLFETQTSTGSRIVL
jgi:hypothetical protein